MVEVSGVIHQVLIGKDQIGSIFHLMVKVSGVGQLVARMDVDGHGQILKDKLENRKHQM